ncbi:MAG: hypothetical protein OQL08_09155 [Gammaproteobacteria bacterium]|nr:hypothetical protein [Gammaproteobacteria bacterium]
MKEQQIIDWIVTRLQGVTVANGYQTDAGLDVGLGRATRDDGYHYVIAADDVEPESQQGNRVKATMEVVIEGYAPADLGNPSIEGRKVLADAERAIFTGLDNRLPLKDIGASLAWGGNSLDYRKDGSDIEICTVTVRATFTKDLTNP